MYGLNANVCCCERCLPKGIYVKLITFTYILYIHTFMYIIKYEILVNLCLFLQLNCLYKLFLHAFLFVTQHIRLFFRALANKSTLFSAMLIFILPFCPLLSFCWTDELLILLLFSITAGQVHLQQPYTAWNVYQPSVKGNNNLKQTKAALQDTQSPASLSFLLLSDSKTWFSKSGETDGRKRERERKREKERPGHPCVLHENGIGFRNLLRTWRSSYMAL